MIQKRRNSKKKPRKKKVEKKVEEKVEEKLTKEELRTKLRAKLAAKRLGRTSKFTREQEIDDIEEKLENKRLPGKDKKRLKDRLKLLEDIEEQQLNAINDDYAEYPDNSGGGGTMVRND